MNEKNKDSIVVSSTSNSEESNQILLISQYKTQLDEVSAAIEVASEEDKAQLQEIQISLINILELTLNQLNSVQSNASNEPEVYTEDSANNIKSSDGLDEEFQKFKSELAELNSEEEVDEKEFKIENLEEMNKLNESLKQLEGQDVRVPFLERWGGFSHHNAVVLNIIKEEDPDIAFENPQVLVLFSQPTSLSMLPCRFFLDGHCKFDSDKCKFSHGHKVAVEDLREYKKPDRDKIVSGTKILALHEGQDIWHRGKIEDVLENRSGFSFNCSNCSRVYEVPLELMFPLYADEDEEQEAKEETNSKADHRLELPVEEEERKIIVPTEVWLQNSLKCKLGEWEKYTRGIGSKLMAKMGYIIGTGLGPKGEGRIDPVAAYVYPQGVSLDHCKQLRESSNGEALWEVEKRLLNQQKKAEERQERQQKYLKTNTSVFDIINDKLGSKSNSKQSVEKSGESQMNTNKSSLKKDSTKELNRKNLQLSSSIDKLKVEVTSLQRTRNRHEKDSTTMKVIDKKLYDKMEELSSLERAANRIESEQQNRRNMQKLCSF